MDEEKKERRTQYEIGHEDGIQEVLVLLSMSIDLHPREPSLATLRYVLKNGNLDNLKTAVREALDRFRERVINDTRQKQRAATVRPDGEAAVERN